VEEPPPPLLTHPVEIALDMAPRCGVEPVDWANTMGQFDVDATALRLAIGDGTVGLHDLTRAAAALSVIGSDADMLELWETADDFAWNHVADVADAAASDDEVLNAHARLAGSTRRDVLAAWGRHGTVPAEVLDLALSDPSPRVRRNAVRLALGSSDDQAISKAMDVCAQDPAVASVAYICP